MSFKTVTVIPGKLFHHIAEDYIHPADVRDLVIGFWKDSDRFEDTVDILWDLRQAKYPSLSFQSMEHLVEKLLPIAPFFKPGRSAILMDDVPEKYLASYLFGLVGNISNRESEICHDIQSATDFLNSTQAADIVS